MASKGSVEDAPRTMREIVQKKFLDEVIGSAGKKIHIYRFFPINLSGLINIYSFNHF